MNPALPGNLSSRPARRGPLRVMFFCLGLRFGGSKAQGVELWDRVWRFAFWGFWSLIAIVIYGLFGFLYPGVDRAGRVGW